MRAATILSIGFIATVLTGCAAESPRAADQETASRGDERTALANRDLTLQNPATPEVEVASPVELARAAPEPKPTRRHARISPKPAAAPVPEPVAEAAPAAVPDTAVTVTKAPAGPAPVEDVAVGTGRELAPGKTVTVIPASTGGPSPVTEEPSWAPAEGGRGTIIEGGGGRGGRCKPRGGVRGIGIAGRIPIGVPGLRLR
jgi:hypothetical protein